LPGQKQILKHAETEKENEKPAESEDKAVKRTKSVKFVDEDERTWQDVEIERLETRVTDLLVDNQHIKRNLEHKGHMVTIRENEIMKGELKNMYALEEENKDLRSELESYKRAGLSEV